MLLTPSLDYQLMEHWSPSLDELIRIEAEEEKAAATAGDAPVPQGPVALRRQHSTDAELKMQADVLEKLKVHHPPRGFATRGFATRGLACPQLHRCVPLSVSQLWLSSVPALTLVCCSRTGHGLRAHAGTAPSL